MPGLATFIQDGDTIDYTPPSGGTNVAVGDVILQGDLIGVANQSIAAGAPGSLSVTGVFDFTKATGVGTAIALGVNVYWDDTLKQAVDTDAVGVNKLIGKSVAAAVDADPTVRVRLSQ